MLYIFAVDNGNEYSVYVKDNKYATEDKMKCNTFTYNGVGTIQTIPFVCKQPLEGKYIHIVTSLTSTLRVYEIEQFGKKFNPNHHYLFGYYLAKRKYMYTYLTL